MGTGALERVADELRRLADGPGASERPKGVGTVGFVAHCATSAAATLERARSVLRLVDEAILDGREPDNAVLPGWFLQECAPPMSREEAEIQLGELWRMTWEDRAGAEEGERWAALAWLYWLGAEMREWYWWDGKVTDHASLAVTVEVDGLPFPSGALRWLLKASGASAVREAE